MSFSQKVSNFELPVVGTVPSADSCFFEISNSIAVGVLLTFAYWNEGLETLQRLGDHVKVPALDPSATPVFYVAVLQTVSKTGIEPCQARL
jgi:hypothetical protein